MSTSSLCRYSNVLGQGRQGDKRLFWNRVGSDGVPFRGPFAPLYTDEEYQEKVVRVVDYRNGFFDVTDDEQNQRFLLMMECCANGWFTLRHIERFWKDTTKHYAEWTEYYMEDGTRAAAPVYSPVELLNGSPNVPGTPR
jgi:hypothetical protein